MKQDTLDRTASTFGITDVEFEDRELILKVLASLPLTEAKVAERKTSNAKGFGVKAERFDFAFEDEGDFGECESQIIASEMDALEMRPAPLGW